MRSRPSEAATTPNAIWRFALLATLKKRPVETDRSSVPQRNDTGIAVPIHRKSEASGRSGGTDPNSRRLRCLPPNHRRTGFVPRGAGPGRQDIGRPDRRSSRHLSRAAPLIWALARVRPAGNARVNSRHPGWFYRRPRPALGEAAAVAGHMLTPLGPKSFTAA
jgi:hypothetical protein